MRAQAAVVAILLGGIAHHFFSASASALSQPRSNIEMIASDQMTRVVALAFPSMVRNTVACAISYNDTLGRQNNGILLSDIRQKGYSIVVNTSSTYYPSEATAAQIFSSIEDFDISDFGMVFAGGTGAALPMPTCRASSLSAVHKLGALFKPVRSHSPVAAGEVSARGLFLHREGQVTRVVDTLHTVLPSRTGGSKLANAASPSIDGQGNIAFTACAVNSSLYGIYLARPNSTQLRVVADLSVPVPNTGGALFSRFFSVGVNNNLVAFLGNHPASRPNKHNETYELNGVYVARQQQGSSTWVIEAVAQQMEHGANKFEAFGDITLSGTTVGFVAALTGKGPAWYIPNMCLYLSDVAMPRLQHGGRCIVKAGDQVPGARNGTRFLGFPQPPSVRENSEQGPSVVFRAGTTDGHTGIFLWREGIVSTLVYTGDTLMPANRTIGYVGTASHSFGGSQGFSFYASTALPGTSDPNKMDAYDAIYYSAL